MRAQPLEVRQDERVLTAQQRTNSHHNYASVANSSAIANTTSSSSRLHSPSRYGIRLDLIVSSGINVATIDNLWMVLTRAERSSVSSSSLNS